MPDVPDFDGAPAPLPKPSLQEPSAIGVALHDPAHVADGVVSMLSLVGIQMVPDNPNADIVLGRRPLQLTEPEVRVLIDLGVNDAEAQARDANGPFTFKTLHAMLAKQAKGVSLERLASMFEEEYQRRPDSPVAQMLMGQPIGPETPLLRTELWAMLVDAVLLPGPSQIAERRGPRLVLASSSAQTPTGVQPWLHRQLKVVDYSSSLDAELLARMSLLLASSLTVAGGSGHEGHGGPGTTIPVEVRLNPRRVVATLPSGLKVFLSPHPQAIAGFPVTLTTDPAIRRHAPGAPVSRNVALAGNGAARLPLTLRPETRTPPRGGKMREDGYVTADVDLTRIAERIYDFPTYADVLPLALRDPVGNEVPFSVHGPVTMEWHGAEIEFSVTNVYNSAALALKREGVDIAHGTLARGDDGLYHGFASLVAASRMELPGKTCGPYGYGWQQAEVVGVPLTEKPTQNGLSGSFYNSVNSDQDYTLDALQGRPSMYLRLEFSPSTPPDYDPHDDCQDEIPGPHGRPTPSFIPLNDARWTIEGWFSQGSGTDQTNRAGYAIAVALATGAQPVTLVYEERKSPGNRQLLRDLGLSKFVTADSTWYVTVTHTKP